MFFSILFITPTLFVLRPKESVNFRTSKYVCTKNLNKSMYTGTDFDTIGPVTKEIKFK